MVQGSPIKASSFSSSSSSSDSLPSVVLVTPFVRGSPVFPNPLVLSPTNTEKQLPSRRDDGVGQGLLQTVCRQVTGGKQ